MPELIAMYKRESGLNVRKKPNPGAEVVRVMQPNEAARCFGVFKGWAKLEDGYANASFLDIEPCDEFCDVVGVVPTVIGQAPEPEPQTDEVASELNQMTNAQLYDLAERSGVKVSKGATKDELIAAILADE